MSEEKSTEGQRVGVHPIFVVFVVIFGLWLFITLIIPKSKNTPNYGEQQASLRGSKTLPTVISSDVIPTYKVTSVVPEMNSTILLVPTATTESQVAALLHFLKKARTEQALGTLLTPTTPKDPLGDFAIADIYIFSDEKYAVAESAKALSRGAHAPGEFYPSSIPYEVAMEQVRGHYSIDLHNKTNPEHASLGFGEDATGVYSKQYQRVF